MAATTVNQLGGDSLFKTIFSGMVLREYEARRLFSPLVTTRNVTRGKAVDFSVLGKVSPHYHTAGENLLTDQDAGSANYLENAAHAKVTVNLNDKLVASTLVDELAELKNDFAPRAELAAEMGRAIADREDRLIAQAITMAALGRRNSAATDTALYTGEPAKGGIITFDDDATPGANLVAAIFTAAKNLDTANVPEDDRYLAIHPKYFHHLAQETDVMNRDWGGGGSFADYKVPRIAGFQVIKSTNIPNVTADCTPDAGENNELDFDPGNIDGAVGGADQMWALAFHKSAAACVKAMDMRTEVEWKPEYQANLMLASSVMGAAALRRQSACVIAGDA